MNEELQNYLRRIEDSRGQISRLISDLPAEALNWRPIDGSEDHAMNSLAVLATHVVGAEHFWLAEVIAGHPPTRDRDAEFVTEATAAAALCQRLEQVGQETREIFSGLSDADLSETRQHQGKIFPIRWALLHVVDHYALHLGHMQITYQLWRGGEAFQAPRWFQRLPEDD